MPEDLETRTVMTPRTGTKICILIGLAFIVAAVYFYFVPATGVRTDSGSVFGCGTAANPSNSTFAKGTCWRVTDVEKYRAFAAAAIGILTIVLGAVMFGVDRRTETRRARHTDGYADDRPRSGDRDRRGWDDEPRRHQDDDRSERAATEGEEDRDRHSDDNDDPRRRDLDDRHRGERDRSERRSDERGWDERDRNERDRNGRGGRDEGDADSTALDVGESRRDRRRPRRDWDDDRG